MTDSPTNQPNEKAHPALEALRREQVEPTQFMKTRILATMQEHNSNRASVNIWKWLTLGITTIAVVLGVGLTYRSSVDVQDKVFIAALNEVIAVKVPAKALINSNVTYAKITVNQGVEFYSDKIPSLKEKRELFVSWEKIATHSYELPIIVKGKQLGKGYVRVEFFNKNHELINEKLISINFNSKG